MDSVQPSGIGGAYSRNPLACEVALAVCDIFEMKTSAAVKVRGLIILACGTYGNVIRFLMPLVITDEELEKGMTIVGDGLATL